VDKGDVDWHGPMPSVITPYDTEGRIDEDAFVENIDLCIGYGMTGLLVGGNSGDFWSLSMDERRRLMALGVEGARGRVPVIACTGAFLAPAVIELTHAAAEAGCAGVMVLPPFFYRPNADDIFAHYKAVSDAAALPVMLYNFPANSVPVMAFDLIERLADLEHIVAIKETSGNYSTFYKILTLVGERIHVFCGQMVRFGVPALIMGASGFIDTNPNLWGVGSVDLYQAAMSGDLVRARALQRKALALHELVAGGGKNTYNWVKTGMTLVGLPGGVARLPQRPLGEEDIAELRRGLAHLGITGRQ
jgi:dihydrodipicolinate synthase/N-acetylneuraminate lyase